MNPTPSSTTPARAGRRVVLTTLGSHGDIHPFVAVALGLRRRGHEAIVATTAHYREKVEAAGLGFRPIRAFVGEGPTLGPELARRIMHPRRGTGFIVRDLVLPMIRASYEDTLAAAEGADLLVAHPLTMATRLVAAVRGIPWASALLAPCHFLSPHDPPIIPLPRSDLLRALGPRFNAPLFRLLKRATGSWFGPLQRLRAELGLPPEVNPLFEGGHSPDLVLALFSGLLGAPQPDWPPQAVLTGFPFHDEDDAGLDPDLARFLDDGPPPVVFTLGTAAVHDAGRFYDESAEAARRLGVRAVLLVGRDTSNRPATLPDGVAAFDYAPFAALFPRAAALVHQGGVGTTGQAMRAGRPMVVVPHAHDQPDNADRARRLGIARVIPRHRYAAPRVARELADLLRDPHPAERARAIAAQVRAERGVDLACDALETLLARAAAP